MKKLLLVSTMALMLGVVQAQELPIITVAFLADTTGESKSLGQEVRNAAALNLVSARLEFRRLGFDLRFKTLDDGGLADVSKRLATAAVADSNVLALVGPISSGADLVVSSILAKANLSNLLTDTDPKLTQRGLSNVFRFLPTNATLNAGTVKYILEKVNARNIALITNNKSSNIKSILMGRLKVDKSITLETFFDQEKGSVDTITKAVTASKPDVIIYDNSNQRSVLIIKALRKAKVQSLNFAFGEMADSSILQAMGTDSLGLYITVLAAPIGAYPTASQFAKRYQKQYKTEMTVYGALSHDALEVTLEALRQAIAKKGGKLPSRFEVNKAFQNVKVDNLFTGSVSFDRTGERINNTIFLLQIGPDGNPRIVDIVKTGPTN